MPQATKPHPQMSPYESAAWTQLIDRVGRRETGSRLVPVKKMTDLATAASERLQRTLESNKPAKTVLGALTTPIAGLQGMLNRAAATSVSADRIIRRAARHDSTITTLDELRKADLQVPDRLLSRHTLSYGIGLGVEGAATSLLVTGFVVSSTVTGGTTLAAAAGAVSADVAVNLAAASRLVAKIAVSYGYDVELPDERLYVLGVLNYGSSMTAGGKAAGLTELSKLVQTMMRNPAHAKLDEFVLVRVTREFVKRLGFRLTHQRIAQLVPVVGAVVNAGTNAASISRLGDRAQDAYRLRFLTEKYELDAADWLSKVDLSGSDEESDFIDLEKLVDEAEDEKDEKDEKDDTDPIS